MNSFAVLILCIVAANAKSVTPGKLEVKKVVDGEAVLVDFMGSGGLICDADSGSDAVAEAACKMAGSSGGSSSIVSLDSVEGAGDLEFSMKVTCSSGESDLNNCDFTPQQLNQCNEYVAATCSSKRAIL